MNSIERSLFVHRIQSICDEMGATIQSTAFSPNIRDRLDFSCAIFDTEGQLCAQAAHIPVHLGSMAFAMRGIVNQISWHPGDLIILNDPFLGGTHLPDVTVISPVFINAQLYGFVANRAHHADIGSETPGSMPVSSRLEEEGIVIPPTHLICGNKLQKDQLDGITENLKNPINGKADLQAQISTNQRGVKLLKALIQISDESKFKNQLAELNRYAERMSRIGIDKIPNGRYEFVDVMDDDGLGMESIPIKVTIVVKDDEIVTDFSGSGAQVSGNINCPISVTAAAVYYCFYCLMPKDTPACAGAFRPITLIVPEGSLLNARRPAAVAAGNVETSTRVVDTVLGALSEAIPDLIPAASQGTMNNIAMGTTDWAYYETIGGGMGGNMIYPGLDGKQSHMTNTLNTPIEVLEMHYPLRINKYEIRHRSGGKGLHKGGNGIIREYQFLEPTSLSLLTERRTHPPWGLKGGETGVPGKNLINGKQVNSKLTCNVNSGDRLTIHTPGGGGWGDQNTK